jgi:hypothetical protein
MKKVTIDESIDQIRIDYDQVHNKIWQDVGFEKLVSMNLRCHEFARLHCAGMKQKGYDASIVDGFYLGIASPLYIPMVLPINHSWVEISGGVILDYWPGKQDLFGYTQFQREIITNRWTKLRYVSSSIKKYKIIEGVEEMARNLFQ